MSSDLLPSAVASDPRATIDVLVPVYNAAATVEGALQSMCRQTFEDFRLLVVDDGSTDGTLDILRRMARAEPRMQIVTKPNGGIVDALNTGLALCDAEFVARFDADDLAFPERLRKQMDYLSAHADCVAVGCNVYFVDSQGTRTGSTDYLVDAVGDPFQVPSLEPYLLHPFLLVRRRAVVEAGGYRYVFHAEDADLYWRLSSYGRLANLAERLGEYRVHDESVSGKSILNGRIAAVSSQLAALSERRRRAGRPDLSFPSTALARYQVAGSLLGILDLACEGLAPSEKQELEVATVAKLFELVAARPYRLAPEDLVTLRKLIETHYFTMSVWTRRQLVFRHLLSRKSGRSFRERSALVPWKIMPVALWETFLFVLGR